MKNKRQEILERIDKACKKCGRNKSEIELLAVSKRQPIEKIEAMYDLGQKSFGENYVQELLEKKAELQDRKIHWHMIGPLQSNKVSKIVGEVELIHSVDSLRLAQFISEKSREKNFAQKILLQINTSGEESKSGNELVDSDKFIESVLRLPGVKVIGLMTMPPFTEDPENSRLHFRKLREIANRFRLSELSMGTTQDFEVAIEEGATIIRIGEAIFGPRN